MYRSELLQIAWRRKLVVVAAAILVLLGAALFLVLQSPVYESKSSVALLPDPAKPNALGSYDTLVPRLLAVYAAQVDSPTFRDQVANSLGAGDLEGKLFSEPVPESGVLKLSGRGDNPDFALRLAQAATQELLNQRSSNGVVTLQVIDPPRRPTSRIAPLPRVVLPAAVVLALVVGIAAAVIWERLFGRIRDLNQLQNVAKGRRVLGAIPRKRFSQIAPQGLFVNDPSMMSVDRSMRTIRTALVRPGSVSPAYQRVVITSLDPGDGKSTLAANLAVMIAEVGTQVLLVDANLHRPAQHRLFQLSNEQGLTSPSVDGQVGLLVQPTDYPKVWVLTSGPPPSTRGEVVDLYVHGIPKLSEAADFVLIDGPALSVDADVGLLATMTDGVVLLVRAGSTSTERLRTTLERLEGAGVVTIGLVLTMTA